MGQEIDSDQFSQADFKRFEELLREETLVLKNHFSSNSFSHNEYRAGFELEAWLLDQKNRVIPNNDIYLKSLDNPNVVPELAMFNFEVNGQAQTLTGNALTNMQSDMLNTWQHCSDIANQEAMQVLMIGILPSLEEEDLCIEHMSHLTRYRALNRQILKTRNYRPLHIHISAKDTLDLEHEDVMLEAASTSFQIHFQVPMKYSVRHYNAAIVSSGPMVAISANSPYLFGKDLWDESRIPLFEQSVEVGQPHHRRVSFGQGFARESLYECFEENLKDYPVLLPVKNDDKTAKLGHLRFHNGTIWRWNRPLIDFNDDDQPHLRIEHRVVPSGPTIVDNIANAAFFYGLCHGMTMESEAIESCLTFKQARNNFYRCAKQGLAAKIDWPGCGSTEVSKLLKQQLLPIAREGLSDLNIVQKDIETYLHIIEQRIDNNQNGANWQRAWVKKNGHDMHGLTCAYQTQQRTGKAVHDWLI